MNKPSQRNQTVDMIRGVAMLMVVLGHTMTGSTENAQNSFLFNLIWALQMPLFMLISGYVATYGRPILKLKDLGNYLKRRTLAYLLPWFSWTFVVRGLIFGQYSFFDIKWLIYNMDSGYWFLFSIWTISVVFGFSQFLAQLFLKKSGIKATLLAVAFYVLGAAMIAIVGLCMGLNFLCIKLTLYYMPFYIAGFLYGKLQSFISKWKNQEKVLSAVVMVAAGAFFAVILRINLYEMADNISGIILRAATSLMGCIAVCGLLAKVFESTGLAKLRKVLVYVGEHSLEVYVIHYLCLSLLKPQSGVAFASFNGFMVVAVNFALTVLISLMVQKLLNRNQWASRLLFGKKTNCKA